jgi:hypothetical protein
MGAGPNESNALVGTVAVQPVNQEEIPAYVAFAVDGRLLT